MNFGRTVDVKLMLDLIRHYSGRSVDVNLVLDLVLHYSGRSVDENSECNLPGRHSCDLTVTTILNTSI